MKTGNEPNNEFLKFRKKRSKKKLTPKNKYDLFSEKRIAKKDKMDQPDMRVSYQRLSILMSS
jgi:hypothetical protein